MSTGKCAKLAPLFCAPFTVLKCIGSSAYRLALLDGVEIHLVFHVSRLKELLGSGDNMIGIDSLVRSATTEPWKYARNRHRKNRNTELRMKR